MFTNMGDATMGPPAGPPSCSVRPCPRWPAGAHTALPTIGIALMRSSVWRGTWRPTPLADVKLKACYALRSRLGAFTAVAKGGPLR